MAVSSHVAVAIEEERGSAVGTRLPVGNLARTRIGIIGECLAHYSNPDVIIDRTFVNLGAELIRSCHINHSLAHFGRVDRPTTPV